MRDKTWQPSFEDPEIQAYLYEQGGEDALEIFAFILRNEPLTGEEILEKYEDRKPSAVRKVLYRLMQAHALEYDKETDSKGWETFHWKTDLPELKLVHLRQWRDEHDHLAKQLRFEEDHEFYVCPHQHRRIIFEDAMDLGFHCPVCQEPMAPFDNAPVVVALRERMDELAPALQV